ncbi:hypothetical protein L1987_21307 [Smallanthus sonchifolius]|uniref:Uncharacterized protein n=1 Tax=Smallanthus sonchifolius TaxID=185202 RepID=A0ACB9IUR8_9ASTR|nr:hypothetical protein L1987_21307 [Smallanthus sonchifolius]
MYQFQQKTLLTVGLGNEQTTLWIAIKEFIYQQTGGGTIGGDRFNRSWGGRTGGSQWYGANWNSKSANGWQQASGQWPTM